MLASIFFKKSENGDDEAIDIFPFSVGNLGGLGRWDESFPFYFPSLIKMFGEGQTVNLFKCSKKLARQSNYI